MLRTKTPNRFKNLNQKWRQCYLEQRRYYPESMLIERDGNYYCKDCYLFRFRKQDLDDFIPQITDDLE